MRCLGIPNTAHFANVTSIEDAVALWQKLKSNKEQERWKPEQEEEFEDSLGNVIPKKTFEDLKRQGLLWEVLFLRLSDTDIATIEAFSRSISSMIPLELFFGCQWWDPLFAYIYLCRLQSICSPRTGMIDRLICLQLIWIQSQRFWSSYSHSRIYIAHFLLFHRSFFAISPHSPVVMQQFAACNVSLLTK